MRSITWGSVMKSTMRGDRRGRTRSAAPRCRLAAWCRACVMRTSHSSAGALGPLTWSQLGFHDKPCGILNVAGYYDRLLQFIEGMVGEGFVSHVDRERVIVASDAAVLLDRLKRSVQGNP